MINKSALNAEKFLKISSHYKLGSLTTELPHDSTNNLSHLAKENLSHAVAILKELDNNVISVLEKRIKEISFLKSEIKNTLLAGKNIYFCGCGATGRLSLTIETLWRQLHREDDLKDRIFSFMSGGDVALIRSIENFEDFPQYGGRQLVESGFRDGDLLITTTEGGETPFVIGAVEKAAEISSRLPFFLYCNPDDQLCEVAERSRIVIENKHIHKINLTVGPMAITGSTRMQASTILLAVAGVALIYYNKSDEIVSTEIKKFSSFWHSLDIQFIRDFIIRESDIYKSDEYLLYETDNKLGITIITDTTERSPTFSLLPFENINEPDSRLSLCYLYMPDNSNSEQAWSDLLWRAPRTLEWPETGEIASEKRLLGFDFSSMTYERRKRAGKNIDQHLFTIQYLNEGINFNLDGISYFLHVPFDNPLFVHLTLKMILNTHSTLIMGILGRYEGNVMTYVKASNNKLIDRSIRYIDLIISKRNISLSYSEICYILFDMIERVSPDESIVLKTVSEIESIHSK